MRLDLIKNYKNLLNILVWEDEHSSITDLVKAVRCPLNPGIPDLDRNLKSYIYVEDILASAVNKQNILRLLAAIIEMALYVTVQTSRYANACSLSKNRRNLWLAWSRQFWDSLLTQTDLQLGSLLNIEDKSESSLNQNGGDLGAFSR
jgi:hypothetical protein